MIFMKVFNFVIFLLLYGYHQMPHYRHCHDNEGTSIFTIKVHVDKLALYEIQNYVSTLYIEQESSVSGSIKFFGNIFDNINTKLKSFGVQFKGDFSELDLDKFYIPYDKSFCNEESPSFERGELTIDVLKILTGNEIGNRIFIFYCPMREIEDDFYIFKLSECGSVLSITYTLPEMIENVIRSQLVSSVFKTHFDYFGIVGDDFNNKVCEGAENCVGLIRNEIGVYLNGNHEVRNVPKTNLEMLNELNNQETNDFSDFNVPNPYDDTIDQLIKNVLPREGVMKPKNPIDRILMDLRNDSPKYEGLIKADPNLNITGPISGSKIEDLKVDTSKNLPKEKKVEPLFETPPVEEPTIIEGLGYEPEKPKQDTLTSKTPSFLPIDRVRFKEIQDALSKKNDDPKTSGLLTNDSIETTSGFQNRNGLFQPLNFYSLDINKKEKMECLTQSIPELAEMMRIKSHQGGILEGEKKTQKTPLKKNPTEESKTSKILTSILNKGFDPDGKSIESQLKEIQKSPRENIENPLTQNLRYEVSDFNKNNPDLLVQPIVRSTHKPMINFLKNVDSKTPFSDDYTELPTENEDKQDPENIHIDEPPIIYSPQEHEDGGNHRGYFVGNSELPKIGPGHSKNTGDDETDKCPFVFTEEAGKTPILNVKTPSTINKLLEDKRIRNKDTQEDNRIETKIKNTDLEKKKRENDEINRKMEEIYNKKNDVDKKIRELQNSSSNNDKDKLKDQVDTIKESNNEINAEIQKIKNNIGKMKDSNVLEKNLKEIIRSNDTEAEKRKNIDKLFDKNENLRDTETKLNNAIYKNMGINKELEKIQDKNNNNNFDIEPEVKKLKEGYVKAKEKLNTLSNPNSPQKSDEIRRNLGEVKAESEKFEGLFDDIYKKLKNNNKSDGIEKDVKRIQKTEEDIKSNLNDVSDSFNKNQSPVDNNLKSPFDSLGESVNGKNNREGMNVDNAVDGALDKNLSLDEFKSDLKNRMDEKKDEKSSPAGKLADALKSIDNQSKKDIKSGENEKSEVEKMAETLQKNQNENKSKNPAQNVAEKLENMDKGGDSKNNNSQANNDQDQPGNKKSNEKDTNDRNGGPNASPESKMADFLQDIDEKNKNDGEKDKRDKKESPEKDKQQGSDTEDSSKNTADSKNDDLAEKLKKFLDEAQKDIKEFKGKIN